jgi:DHA1 family bicyclomycin/chloramphenicol resistance-like MFS transporter
VVGSILTLMSIVALPETRIKSETRTALVADYQSVLRHHGFAAFTLAGSFVLAAWFVYVSMAAFIYTELFGLRADQIGLLTIITTIGYILGSLISTKAAGAIGFRRMTIAGLALCGGAGATLFIFDRLFNCPLVIAVGAMCLFSAGMGITNPNTTGGALDPFPSRAGTASALFGFAMMMAAATTTLLTGAFGVRELYELGVVILVFVAIGAVSMVWLGAPTLSSKTGAV